MGMHAAIVTKDQRSTAVVDSDEEDASEPEDTQRHKAPSVFSVAVDSKGSVPLVNEECSELITSSPPSIDLTTAEAAPNTTKFEFVR
mmetsp:Transcript_11071/g.23383  ORF Transcript_11071/g.23383 Transcript_11071/m.23383 type:complete len:87 (-) Transcript_11071:939-1199(-)